MSVAARAGARFTGSSRLGGFIAASIAAHCLLLAGWTDNDTVVLPIPSKLAVTVISAKPTAQPAVENSGEHVATRRDRDPARHVIAPPDTVTTTDGKHSTKSEMPAVAETAPAQQPGHPQDVKQATMARNTVVGTPTTVDVTTSLKPAASIGQIKKHIDEQLHSNFARHFHYPPLAQRRNWQGEVRLGLRIEASGHLSHIRIIKSSGYTILDEAALASLRQVTTIPQAGHWLRGKSFDTILPVKYRLLDS